ncbi:ribbon-helix-helix domain-containing protein [Aureimonas sp. SK2]|uniref:ribbon-helix-helix domain-containing protein n=1 Tax=Aureimonas sp. SK2 TaxID=3015992 RepID=UPI00387E39CF
MSTKKGRTLADMIGGLDEDLDTSPPASPPPVNSVSASASAAKIVPISVLVSPEDRKRLRQLSLDTGLSIQKLGHEAFNKMLEARGLPPLEAVSANVPSGRSRR